MKRKLLFILSLIMAVCMSIFAIGCFGEYNKGNNNYPPTSQGLEYELSQDGTYYIVTGIGVCTDTNLVIPTIYNDLPVKEIGDYAFLNCSKLTSIVIPDSITSIGNFVFSNCSKLTSIVIPDSVESIGRYAFLNCSKLTSIVRPDSVTSIGDWAFSSCGGLTSIVIPDSVGSIGVASFAGCNSLTKIIVDEDNAYYKSIDGNLYSKDGKTLVQYAIGKTGTTFTIPDSVEVLGDRAFADCDSLATVTIGNSVEVLGDYVFYYCSNLTSIVIPDSVTSIGEGAFACSSLTSIVIPDSVTSIGYGAFYDCDSLTSITFEDTSNWYMTTNKTDWQNKENGELTDLTNPTTNDDYFKSTYYNYYWYKK